MSRVHGVGQGITEKLPSLIRGTGGIFFPAEGEPFKSDSRPIFSLIPSQLLKNVDTDIINSTGVTIEIVKIFVMTNSRD